MIAKTVKLLFAFLLVCILCATLSSADLEVDIGFIGSTNDSTPSIDVTFSEPNVTLVSFDVDGAGSLTYTKNETNATTKYRFQVNNILYNGPHTFFVSGKNSWDTVVNGTANFTVDVDYIDIALVQPPLGIATTAVFDVRLRTQPYADSCKLGKISLNDNFNNITTWYASLPFVLSLESPSSPSFFFINNFNQAAPLQFSSPEEYKNFTVICKAFNTYHLAKFELGYDTTAPVVNISLNPNPVVDYGSRMTLLNITTSDRSVCTIIQIPSTLINNVSAEERANYLTLYSTPIFYDFIYSTTLGFPNFHFDYTAQCVNLAGLSTLKTFSVDLAFETDLTITQLSPSFIKETDTVVNLETNLLSDCYLNGTFMQSFDNGKTHSLSFVNLPQGNNTFLASCEAKTGAVAEKIISVFVDSLAPTGTVIDAHVYTCSLSTIQATMAANDSGSGVKGFNVSLMKGTQAIMNWTFLSGNPKQFLVDTNLTSNAVYTWNAHAIDHAGNVAALAVKSVTAVADGGDRCDFIPPVVDVSIVNTSEFITSVRVSCSDNGSGCSNNFNYSFSEDGSCSYASRSTLETLLPTYVDATFCYLVSDNNGNVKSGSVYVDVLADVGPLTITHAMPEYVATTFLTLEVRTNLAASCLVDNATMTKAENDRKHTKSFTGLSQGERIFSVRCNATNETAQKDIEVFIDSLAPSSAVITANSRSCVLDELQASFEANDSGSGVKGFNYSISKGSTVVAQWRFVDDNPADVERSIDLDAGSTYTWNVVTIDKAGNKAAAATKSIIASDEDETACDETPPTVSVNVTNVTGGVMVELSCRDAGVGCATKYNYSFSSTSTCAYRNQTTYGTRLLLKETKYFCYYAYDKNDNVVTGKKQIVVRANRTTGNDDDDPDASCNNGRKDGSETGIDCGGSCDSCPNNADCEQDADCDSGYCGQGICKLPLCTDVIKNGRESDVDCGGNCTQCAFGKLCYLNTDCQVGLICRNNKCSYDCALDSDADGMNDCWEQEHFNCKTCADAKADPDKDGFNNLKEYIAGTDPDDKESHPERKSILPLLLLILGIALMIGGLLYVFVFADRNRKNGKEAIMIQNTLEKMQNPEMSDQDVKQNVDTIVSRMYQKKAVRKDDKREKLFKSFEEGKESENESVDAEATGTKFPEGKQAIMIKKKDDKNENKEDDEYVDLAALKDKESLRKEDMKKQVFERLEGLSKNRKKVSGKLADEKVETAKKISEAKTSKSPKPKTAFKSTPSKMTNKEVFAKLAELAKQSKTKVQKVMTDKKTVSHKDMMNIFAELTDKKQLNQDVFKVILSELLSRGKLTKTTVTSMLFKFMEQNLLTKKEVNQIMDELKLK
ncbi:hypothetical protein C4573_01205 [Candidatus Woesearchaeota archaeon]|nr:MAG: hypothetical protein C4573_01205 [Candidatus Woesearchaeota archaeon]